MSTPSLAEFFLGSKSNVLLYETIEVIHPSFSQAYRIVRNNRLGGQFGINGVMQSFDYYPLKITRMNSAANLDQSIKVTIGDVGSLLTQEIKCVRDADTFSENPKVIYRAYRSDNPMEPVIGPLDLEMVNVSITRDGSAFEARPPTVNANTTGEIYTMNRFPGLRGFL